MSFGVSPVNYSDSDSDSDESASIGSHQIAHVGSGMKDHVEPSCHLVFSVCGYRRGFIIMWSYSEISAERSQAFWKRLNLYFIE